MRERQPYKFRKICILLCYVQKFAPLSGQKWCKFFGKFVYFCIRYRGLQHYRVKNVANFWMYDATSKNNYFAVACKGSSTFSAASHFEAFLYTSGYHRHKMALLYFVWILHFISTLVVAMLLTKLACWKPLLLTVTATSQRPLTFSCTIFLISSLSSSESLPSFR